jgi:nucleoside-diphosphate-sugar epimerase
MMRALVFGANGFIGGHVTKAVLGAEIEVVGAGLGAPLAGLERTWLDIDLLGPGESLDAALAAVRPDVLVNCTGATIGSGDELHRLNVAATRALLDAIDRSRVPARFVHIGSAAEYGRGVVGGLTPESAGPRPLSAYGIAKLAATQAVGAWAAAGHEAVVLRVFNVLGPGMPAGTLPGAATRTLAEAARGAAKWVEFGPLGAVRDFVDVRDVATAVVAACRSPRLEPIVNVGTGIPHPTRDLVRAIAERVGFSGEIQEATDKGSPRSAHVDWQVADVSRAERVLGWRATYDLASTVEFMTPVEGGPG